MTILNEMTDKELKNAYSRASRFGEGDLCDEILAEMDRRQDDDSMGGFNYVGSKHHY